MKNSLKTMLAMAALGLTMHSAQAQVRVISANPNVLGGAVVYDFSNPNGLAYSGGSINSSGFNTINGVTFNVGQPYANNAIYAAPGTAANPYVNNRFVNGAISAARQANGAGLYFQGPGNNLFPNYASNQVYRQTNLLFPSVGTAVYTNGVLTAARQANGASLYFQGRNQLFPQLGQNGTNLYRSNNLLVPQVTGRSR